MKPVIVPITEAEKRLTEQGMIRDAAMDKLPIDPNNKTFTSANWIGKGDCMKDPVPLGELTPLQKLRQAEPDFYRDHAKKMGLIKE